MAHTRCICGHELRSHELLSEGGNCNRCPCDYFELDEDQFQPKLRRKPLRDYEEFIFQQEENEDYDEEG